MKAEDFDLTWVFDGHTWHLRNKDHQTVATLRQEDVQTWWIEAPTPGRLNPRRYHGEILELAKESAIMRACQKGLC